jgi:hypothetical protein
MIEGWDWWGVQNSCKGGDKPVLQVLLLLLRLLQGAMHLLLMLALPHWLIHKSLLLLLPTLLLVKVRAMAAKDVGCCPCCSWEV